jgi:hypothetical protein
MWWVARGFTRAEVDAIDEPSQRQVVLARQVTLNREGGERWTQSARFSRNFSGFSKKSRLGGLRLHTLVPETFPTVDGRGPPTMRARGVGSVSDRKLDGASPARLRDRKTSAPFLVRVSSPASHACGETQRTAANHQCEARKPHSFSALILEAFNWAGSMQGQLLSDGRRRYHSQALLGS